jgi:outer membrane protein insertion porin family
VSFGPADDDLRTVGADVAFDTRIDPALPRNAVFIAAGAERVFFASGGDVTRTRVDARGYVGVIGQQVLAIRALREDASRPLPPYLQSLLGAQPNVRGFERGYRTGDTLVAGSLEYRVPISSPLSTGKLGVSVFADWGTAYAKGAQFRDQRLERGAGAGVWFALSTFRLSVAVAHGRGAGTRAHFGGAMTF